MSQRLIFTDIKNSRIPALLNVCPTDSRLKQWLNRFEELASNQGRWWGTVQEMLFCVEDDCVVLPRQVAAIEAATLNNSPVDMGNQWYRYLHPVSPTVCASSTCCSTMAWAGGWAGGWSSAPAMPHLNDPVALVCTFSPVIGENKKLKFYPADAADVGKKIVVQGRSGGNWVRTTFDGMVQDGEQVTLALPSVTTLTTWDEGSPTGIIKEATSYHVLVYEVDTVTLGERLIADYEPGETRPQYRRIDFTNVCCGGTCPSDNDADCTSTKTLKVIASLQHIPIETDNDWLLFQNLAAYQDGMMAMKYQEEGDFSMANAYMYGTAATPRNGRGPLRALYRGGAIPALAAELRKMTGDRTTLAIRQDRTSLTWFR